MNAVALALIFVVANQRADDTHRIVFTEHAPGFNGLTREEQANHFGDVGLNRAAFEFAKRLLALQTTPSLFNDVCSHNFFPPKKYFML